MCLHCVIFRTSVQVCTGAALPPPRAGVVLLLRGDGGDGRTAITFNRYFILDVPHRIRITHTDIYIYILLTIIINATTVKLQ